MSFEFTDGHLAQIKEYAEIGFSWREIATVLRINAKTFNTEWLNERSLVREAYDAGKLKTKASLELKRTAYAIGGNITVMQMVDQINKAREFEELKEKHLYDG